MPPADSASAPAALRAPLRGVLERILEVEKGSEPTRGRAPYVVVALPGAGLTTALTSLCAAYTEETKAKQGQVEHLSVDQEVKGLRAGSKPHKDVRLLILDHVAVALAQTGVQGRVTLPEVLHWAQQASANGAHVVISATLAMVSALLGPRETTDASAFKWHWMTGLTDQLVGEITSGAQVPLTDWERSVFVGSWSASILERWVHDPIRVFSAPPNGDVLDSDEMTRSRWLGREIEAFIHEHLPPLERQELLSAHARRRPTEGEPEPIRAARLHLMNLGLLLVSNGQPQLADPLLAWYLARRLPPRVRIHHLSDVHFGLPHGYTRPGAPAPAPSPPRARITPDGSPVAGLPETIAARSTAGSVVPCSPTADYEEHLRNAPEKPDLVIISGDVGERAEDDELDRAAQWIEHINEIIRPGEAAHPGRRVQVVGGNHDVNWARSGDTDPDARHQGYKERLIARLYGARDLQDLKEQRPRVRDYPDLGVEVLLLESAVLGGQRDPHVGALRPRLKQYTALLKTRLWIPKARVERERAALDEVIAQIERQYGKEDPGLVDGVDIAVLRDLTRNNRVRIAVLHHPLGPIPGASVKAYPILTNSAALKGVLVQNGWLLVLHGHEHQYYPSLERPLNLEMGPASFGFSGLGGAWPPVLPLKAPRLLVVSAPTLASTGTADGQGFVELLITRELDERGSLISVDVELFRYSPNLESGSRARFVATTRQQVRVMEAEQREVRPLLPPPTD